MSLLLTDGLAALGGTIKPTPRREEPVATGSSLTSCPYLATYKVARKAGSCSFSDMMRLEALNLDPVLRLPCLGEVVGGL